MVNYVSRYHNIAGVDHKLNRLGGLVSVYNGKTLLMFAICFFGLGSVVCGSAKSINAVIVGRALSGIGAAGSEFI